MIPTGASPATFYLSPPGLRSKWPAHVCQCWCPVWLRSPFWDSHRTVVPLCWVMLSHFFKRAETKSRYILCYTLIYIYVIILWYIYIYVIILIYIYYSLWYHTVYIILIITNIYIYISMCVMVIIVIIVISMIVCIWPFGRVT